MLKTKRILAAAVALLATRFVCADVLESAPADALVAIQVANLSKTSAKVAKLAKDFGIDAFVPPLQDPLGALKGQANITKGLLETGELGFAIFKSPEGSNEPGLIVLIPISNFADFVSNFANAKTEGGVAEVQFPGDQNPSYVGDWGKYAAVSPTRNLVAAKPTATLKPVGTAAKEVARQDIVLYANFARITPEAQPELEKFIAKATAEMDKGLAKDVPAKWHPLIKTSVNQLFGVARGFFRDAESATIGLNISDAGLNATVVSEFKKDSYAGKAVSGIKNTEAPLTVGLPAIKYLAFGGATSDPAALTQLVDDLTKPIVDELNKIEGQEKAQTAVKNLLAATKATNGYIFGMPVPAKIGQDGVFQQVTIYKGGGKELKLAFDSTGDFAKTLLADVKTSMKEKNPQAPDQIGDLTLTPNARTVEGLAFDTIKIEMPQAKDNPAAMQAEMMLGIFYGTQGMSYSYAPLGNDLVFAQSASDETIAKFIQSVKANQDNLSKLDHVKAVTVELPKARLYEAYISLDEFVNTGVGVAATFGMPVPVQLPPDLPPVGLTMGSDGTAIRFDVHIPSTTVQQLIAAGLQIFQQFQGGPGGGGGNL